jgi:hypothetical protein
MAKKYIEDDTELDKVPEYARGDNYTVSHEQTWDVQTMIANADTVTRLLVQRNWALLVAEDGAPDFICSDCPVSWNWIKDTGTWLPPGLGVPNTMVSAPLNRRVAVVGTFEPLPDQDTVGPEEVAAINSATFSRANQIFSATEDFLWSMSGGIGHTADLLTALESQPSEGK